MKKAAILFVLIFLFTAIVPLYALYQSKKQEKAGELVTIFSSCLFEEGYNFLQP